jgi:uncharacterized protein YcbK (DUF882 family)
METDDKGVALLSRRAFLGSAAAAAALPFIGSPAVAGQATPPLWLLNRHTGEEYLVPLFVGSSRNPRVYPFLDYLLRDHHEDVAVQMDRRLYDLLYAFQRLAGQGARVEILSGYRTPKTNAILRSHSEAVAVHSYHMRAQAVDFVVTGMPTKVAAKLAWMLGFGGVGLYGDDFCHCDTGPLRKWGDPF